MNKYLHAILSSSLGNILEWYDFGLFTLFSTLFSQIFFPSYDKRVGVILVFSIFLVGFACRPMGALIFGYLGDRWGRAITIRWSILMISLPTLIISFLPTYDQLGITAPILLMLIRMWQGISLGGEYTGNIIYLAEIAPPTHRAIITSLASLGANLGILLASIVSMLVNNIFTSSQLMSWGWRIPYFISGILCILIYLFRLHLPETAVFQYLQKSHQLSLHPIHRVLKNDFKQLLRTMGIVCMGSTFYYFIFTYLPIIFTAHTTFEKSEISLLMSIIVGVMIFLIPLAGLLCDKFGRRKMLLLTSSLVVLFIIPGFHILQSSNFMAILGTLCIFILLSALEQGATAITAVENFPLPARYVGVSLGYNIVNGILGGTVPMVCALFHLYFSLAPAYYIAMFALITGLTVYFFVPETKEISLFK